MARTWPVTRRKKAMLAAFDAIARPVSSLLFRDKTLPTGDIRKILVLELWHIGDVVLATPALQRLRAMYPKARITLLGKQHAAEVLEHSGLVDEVVVFDFPWTAMDAKYDPARYDSEAIKSLVRRLRAEQFDLSIDCRMDLRSNVLTKSIGAKRRIGYAFGGGAYLLTDAVTAPPADQHKVDDWMGLFAPLGASGPVPDPLLKVSAAEIADAKRVLASYEIDDTQTVVGIHPGGSHEAKRWLADNFAQAGRALADRHDVRLIVFVDPAGTGSDMQLGREAAFVRTSIREMMALLTQCDLLICNDSGPMHIAAALGVPVVAVFRTGNPKAYGPRGLNHSIVGDGGNSDVPVDDVLSAAESTIARAAG